MTGSGSPDAARPRIGLSAAAVGGCFAAVALLLFVTAWAALTPISGAVIASGSAVVRGQPRMVESVDGGLIEQIRVTNGDRVRAGEVLLRLDPTLLRMNLDMYRTRLAETRAEIARLTAERAGDGPPQFDTDTTHVEGVARGPIHRGQAEIFAARREVMTGRETRANERIAQLRNRISGVEGVAAARRDQLELIDRELADIRALHAGGLVRKGRMLELQRHRARLLGEIAEHDAELARLRNAIRDARLEMGQAEREFREQVVTDLRAAMRTRDELVLQIVTARKRLDRVAIRAPVDGVVHEMQVSNAGGVVPPGETILQVIPLADGVEFEVRVAPDAIDQVSRGQRAKVVFPVFDARTTPEIRGTVSGISPNSITDPATRQRFYRVSLAIPPSELARLGDREVLPGMPIEAFLQTGTRKVLSYLTRPLTDNLRRAFREG
jgi:HlyD family secretion protein